MAVFLQCSYGVFDFLFHLLVTSGYNAHRHAKHAEWPSFCGACALFLTSYFTLLVTSGYNAHRHVKHALYGRLRATRPNWIFMQVLGYLASSHVVIQRVYKCGTSTIQPSSYDRNTLGLSAGFGIFCV